jgi:fatty-acyl-CoA synthase
MTPAKTTLAERLVALKLDLQYVVGFLLPIKLHVMFHQYVRRRFSVADMWRRSVARDPDKVALLFHGQRWTFAELDALARRTARALGQHALEPGTRVAIFGENCPAFWWHALALLEMACVPVVLRPSLSEAELLEFLSGYGPLPLLLVGEGLAPKLPEAVRARFGRVHAYALDGADVSAREPTPAAELAERRRDVTVWSEVFHIGTSNTTGVSKSCVERHGSILGFILGHQFMKRLTPEDRVYTTATLSHGEGFAVGGLVPWAIGASVCLDDTFDAERYFEECRKNEVTVMSYVGVMPRRLLSTRPSPADRAHRVRVASGHEMLDTTWREFQERFGIPQIVEYFAATEGTYFFKNDTMPGAVGLVGPLGRALFPFAVVRLDENNEMVREGGKPVLCERGEVGEIFGMINASDPCALTGYADARLDERAQHRSLFRKGDRWYRSGDLVRHDPSGFVYFAGKRSTSFQVRGAYVNPQFVEDKLAAAAASGRLGVLECLGFFVERTDGTRAFALRLSLDHAPSTAALFEELEAVLNVEEVPDFVVLDDAPLPYTDSLRRRRLKPVVAEAELRAGPGEVLLRGAPAEPSRSTPPSRRRAAPVAAQGSVQ